MVPIQPQVRHTVDKAKGSIDNQYESLATHFASMREEIRRFVDRRMNASLKRRVDASDIVQETQVEAL
jgi:DNA-directed RNA polymerase specialized sigma24 family protein